MRKEPRLDLIVSIVILCIALTLTVVAAFAAPLEPQGARKSDPAAAQLVLQRDRGHC